MRDAFGSAFPMDQEKKKENNPAQELNFNISSNGYYGYQPLPQREEPDGADFEHMEVQMSDSGIQFNNYIAPEDRLSAPQEMSVIRGPANRKRRCSEVTAAVAADFKKRRQCEPMPELPTPNRYVNSRQPTHNVPDISRCLMGNFI